MFSLSASRIQADPPAPAKVAKPKAAEPKAAPAPETKKSTGEKPATDKDKAAGNATASKAEFERQLTQWKGLLQQLQALRNQFGAATPADRLKLLKDYQKLLGEGEALLPKVTTAAENAFVAQPEGNVEIVRFLTSVARDANERDDYEVAARIAKLLVEHGANDPPLLEIAAVACFNSNDFEGAEKYLAAASAAGPLSPAAKQAASQLAGAQKAWAAETKIRAAEAKADDLPRVKFHTNQGDVVLELFENEAPKTVANFVNLVDKGYYNGLTFHRVIQGFMAQGGCPKGDGTGGPGYNIPDEQAAPNARKHFRGSISMANTGRPDTGGSQFFLTFVPTTFLDGRHAVFGRVIEGTDVLAKIHKRNPDSPQAKPGDKIITATVVRKRDHKYEPEKLPESK
ncbi:MAG: peptidylprolyl isomerase [Planctomycetia bacterium]|nr:peptidylprolyl isomerase [Planctomycetia bacterium]